MKSHQTPWPRRRQNRTLVGRSATGAGAAVLLSCVLSLGCSEQTPPVLSEPDRASTAAAPQSASPPAASARPAGDAPTASAPRWRPNPDQLVVLAGGDVNLGRYVADLMAEERSYDPFRALAPLLLHADLRFVNLESQLSDRPGRTVHPRSILIFTGTKQGATVLRQAGIDMVSVANNHMWDFGKRALLETLEHLEAAGIAYAGASRKPGRAYQPVVLRVRDWSIALFAVTHIWNQPPYRKHPGRFHVAWADYSRLHRSLKRARREHDVVLVSYHGGGEYIDRQLPVTRQFAAAVMRAGVDALIGHHPHVTQGVQFHGARPVLFSLGNLVFEPFVSTETKRGFMARLVFDRARPGQPAAVQLCPYWIGDRYMPRPLTALGDGERAALVAWFRQRVEQTSRALGRLWIGEFDARGCAPVSARQPE